MISADGSRSTGLLAGVTIVDMTRVLSGPYATMILRRLGARVIKVERPGTGDDARAFGPFVDGRSTYFASLNCGKESIALDLDEAGDVEVLHQLIARADVFVENFRPGVLARHGLDYDSLRRRYPRLVYGSITGFGQDGPYRDRPAYDIVVQAMSGMMTVTGDAGAGPTRVGVSIGDMAAGLYLAIGLCSALYERTLTGCGRYIDVAMLDCQVALLENMMTAYLATGIEPRAERTRHPSVAPFAAFHAADGDLVIAAANDRLFEALCRALNRPALATDERFRTNELRHRHVDALTQEIEVALAGKPASHWLKLLEAAGVPCAPVNTLAQAAADPQLAVRKMIVPAGSGTGTLRVSGNPIKVSGALAPEPYPPEPALDADRARLLRELAGQNQEEVSLS